MTSKIEEKPSSAAVEQHEGTDTVTKDEPSPIIAKTDAAAAKGQLTTGYEDLGVWETVSKFKMACAICFCATLSAVMDGCQISRSAAELDELFERKIKPWRFRHTEAATQRLLAEEKSKLDA